MAKRNAALDLKTAKADQRILCQDLLKEVQRDLHLCHLPRRIEGFDISNLGPTEAVGSMVFWNDAMPVKSRYRRYNIKGIRGIDDYGMMAEVIRRRYTRLREENGRMPDLILIDGGKGHLQAGLHVLSEMGLTEIPAIGLAKREELIYLSGMDAPLDLPARSPTLRLLQRIRDEAHRFALSFQRQRRTKRAFSSALDRIPGVGAKRKAMLLKHFSGVDGIKKASLADLASIHGIDRNTAKRVFSFFHGDKEGD